MGQSGTLRNCKPSNNLRWVCQVDIGIWMSRAVLAHKLELRTSRNPRATWNLRNWPQGYVEGEENRLFVACEGKWIGYFKLAPYMIWNRFDTAVPYTLVFDTRTWTPTQHVPVHRFRGFTHNVPAAAEPTATNERHSEMQ
jgi:hypothetical protein